MTKRNWNISTFHDVDMASIVLDVYVEDDWPVRFAVEPPTGDIGLTDIAESLIALANLIKDKARK